MSNIVAPSRWSLAAIVTKWSLTIPLGKLKKLRSPLAIGIFRSKYPNSGPSFSKLTYMFSLPLEEVNALSAPTAKVYRFLILRVSPLQVFSPENCLRQLYLRQTYPRTRYIVNRLRRHTISVSSNSISTWCFHDLQGVRKRIPWEPY